MRVLLAAFCFMLLALGAGPPAAAQAVVFEEITVNLTSEAFTAHFKGDRYTASESVWLRNLVDEDFGDGDGTVTPDEVDAFVEAMKDEMNGQMATPFAAIAFSGVRIGASADEARASVTRTVTDIRYTEAILGPVDNDEEVVRELDALLTFADTPRSRLTVVFADDFRRPFSSQNMQIEWEEAVFRGAAPWAIDAATIDPESARESFFEGDAFRVGFDEMGTFSSATDPLAFELVNTSVEPLEPEEEKGSPGPGAALLVVGLALAALVRRRSGF